MTKVLEAKVPDDYRIPVVTAFGGREYRKGEWRLVPAEEVDSAMSHLILEVREVEESTSEEMEQAAPTAPSSVKSSKTAVEVEKEEKK